MKKNLIVTAATVAALMLAPVAASASPDGNFGSHVSQHAQDHGFSGTHNPGVHHQGASGWMAGDHHIN
ncbi:MAG: hypothetical protein P1T08_11985 [Acidimicrobiia bacterium]|nr:hypothetical protein [Acidimicrobiia bacterium]